MVVLLPLEFIDCLRANFSLFDTDRTLSIVFSFFESNAFLFILFFLSVNSLLNNSQYWFECAYAAYANELIIFQLKDVNKFFRKQFLNGKIKMKANICNWKASMKTSSCIVIANQVKCNTLPYLFMYIFTVPIRSLTGNFVHCWLSNQLSCVYMIAQERCQKSQLHARIESQWAPTEISSLCFSI